MTLRPLSMFAALAVIVMSVSAASAQTPIDDPLDVRDAKRLDRMEKVVRELRAIVFQGRDIGKPVVVQPAETDFQVQELTRRVRDLETTLTRLNGQLEGAAHDLELARRANEAAEAQNKALVDRVTVLEQRAAQAQAPAEVPPVAEATPAPAAPSAAELFAKARQQMMTGDYAAAEGAWQDYVTRFGETPKAPEARYWLGKTLAVRAAHADAATAYIGAIRGWPQTLWAPDALVELSRELIALKRPADACQMLSEFDRRYPKALPAVKGRAVAARTQAKCAA